MIEKEQPSVLIIDSIQTLYTEELSSAPGSVAQVRETAARLVRLAKERRIALFLVGQVTKEGMIAGPRVLEHMVDTVLYFEGGKDSRYRLLRAVKNRFGAVNELGIFAMGEEGLRQVTNPSAIFLSRGELELPGSMVFVTWEGTRPLLIEMQALVDTSYGGNPKRLSLGFDLNRLSMIHAVLHRHAGIASYDQDVYLNVVGGMKISETALDLPGLLAIVSSLRNQPVSRGWVAFGEIGLAGEIRPVHRGQERLQEAAKHGFTHALVPKGNLSKRDFGLKAYGVETVQEALQLVF